MGKVIYMKKFKKIFKLSIAKLINFVKNIYYGQEIGKLADSDYSIKYDVPSFTQWESRELIEDIIKGKFDCKNDPLWKNSGAENPEEYEMYSWQMCGMTCLKMILKSVYPDKEYRLVDLAKDAEKVGVYKRNNDKDPRHNLDGMFHNNFLKFIKKFGLKGFRAEKIKENYIANLILNNCFIVSSVHPSIREDYFKSNSKTGHLVLVKGFKVLSGKVSGFFINNPSGYLSNNSQKNYFVPIEKWNKYFSGNIDAITL